MIKLFQFVPKEKGQYKGDWIKPLREFAYKPQVPEFWGGYIVLVRPTHTHSFCTAYWVRSTKCKTAKKAEVVIPLHKANSRSPQIYTA